jgi:topoisomerase-4 subunit A
MTHLFATTDLERSYKVNLNVIGLNGKPKVKNLLEIIKEWLEFRKQTVTKRLQYRLDKVLTRMHILDGLLIAFLNIDEIIKIIRNEDEPKERLIKKYKLSETQAEAILELKLRNLAKLEETKIKAEQQDLSDERQTLEELLNSSDKLKKLIKKELTEDLAKYKDSRQSIMVERAEAKVVATITQAPSTQATVVLSEKGWVRSGKGHELALSSLTYKSGDQYLGHILTMTDDYAVFLTSDGKSYSLLVSTLPSARGYGEPLTSKLTLEPGAVFKAILAPGSNYLLATEQGYGFVVEYPELVAKNKKGKAIVNLPAGVQLIKPAAIASDLALTDLHVVLITSDARLLAIKLAEIPVMTKGRGKKLITLSGDAKLVNFVILSKKDKLKLSFNKKVLEMSLANLQEYAAEIGQRATKLPKGYQNITNVEII